MQLAIIGINGLVGQEFINLIKNNYFYNKFFFIGSEKSKGLSYKFRNKV
jgi:aspartate-semialdehyde dehydrogenase